MVAAFDQNQEANRVYRANFGRAPSARNLATIRAAELPRTDLWWLSPPCAPFTIRGRRRDDADPRAQPLLNLIECAAVRRPAAFLLENVLGFIGSRVHERLRATLMDVGYELTEWCSSPTDFGVPMKRPRVFVIATLPTVIGRPGNLMSDRRAARLEPLARFLDPVPAPELFLAPEIEARYGSALDVVDPAHEGAALSCQTRGYARSLTRSGSFLREAAGGACAGSRRRSSCACSVFRASSRSRRTCGWRRGCVWPATRSTCARSAPCFKRSL